LKRKEKKLSIDHVDNQQQEQEDIAMNPEKTKEQILAERQAKKASKQVKKPEAAAGNKDVKAPPAVVQSPAKSVPQAAAPLKAKPVKPELVKPPAPPAAADDAGKSKEQIHAEREARKLAKQGKKKSDAVAHPTEAKPAVSAIVQKVESLKITETSLDTDKPKAKPSKAEMRAKQEAQRAAKAKLLEEKKAVATKPVKAPPKQAAKVEQPKSSNSTTASASTHKVRLFKHLYANKIDLNINVNQQLHPAVVKLGLQYASDAVVGANARCYAFLNVMKTVS